VIVEKARIRAALDRAQDLGALSIEEACASAAQSLGVHIDLVREVAFELTDGSAEASA
jgi:hypothetical protein